MTRLSLGAGAEPEKGYINVDLLDLPGIDVVHNLMEFPWPFEDESADYIKAKDLIEHLAPYTILHTYYMGVYTVKYGQPTIIAFIEEAHRILKPGGTLWIQTPRFDAEFLWIDPTHVRGFHERSFDFFDKTTDFGKSTGFYSQCKFKVKSEVTENKNLVIEMVKR
jgi:predicted SAM-dependent methyltransferase